MSFSLLLLLVMLGGCGCRWWALADGGRGGEETILERSGGYEVFESKLGDEHGFRALRTARTALKEGGGESCAAGGEEEAANGESCAAEKERAGGILGGIFTSGVASGESVFGAFHMHEAVRLVERSSDGLAASRALTALQVGLGIGVVASALERHGVVVDAVEIDAHVLDAARRFFGFRRNDAGGGGVMTASAAAAAAEDEGARAEATPVRGRDFVEDGARFLERVCEGVSHDERATWAAPYDFVVHDVWNGDFLASSSGGGDHDAGDDDDDNSASVRPWLSSSSPLYMLETFEAAACVMREDGVFVLNYYGFADGRDFAAVVKTLARAFPVMRAFHDGNRDNASAAPFNIAVFARRSGNALVFLEPRDEDFLESSTVRYDALARMHERELDIASLIAGGDDNSADDIPVLRASRGGAYILWRLQQQVRDAHRRAVLDHESGLESSPPP